jgi:hypothetical protein
VLYIYAIQGLVGGLVSSVFVHINQNLTTLYPNIVQTQNQIIGAVISLGMGMGSGIVIGVFLLLVSS